MSTRIKVMIVDDSAVVRQTVRQALERDAGIEVIAAASDPLFAISHMQRQWPDVVVLDIEMPRMDGLTFLKKIMTERPTPVVICSSLAESGAAATMQALSAGAVAIITKPKMGVKQFLEGSANDVVHAVKAAARANASGPRVDTCVDMRDLLARSDIDALAIGTPNHLHALQAIWCMQAGKDVFLEKPVSHNVWEGAQLVAAAESHESRPWGKPLAMVG